MSRQQKSQRKPEPTLTPPKPEEPQFEYKVLSSSDDADGTKLQLLIAQALTSGWEPLGGVAVTTNSNIVRLFQAVVRNA